MSDSLGASVVESGGRGLIRRVIRGSEGDPSWVRPALLCVLALSAFLNLWALTISGTGNEYYAAAVLSGTKSWKAFFFGALDASSFITVDKPPLSFWVMGISARVLGFTSWSVLLPQALMGIGAVGFLFGVVRRAFGAVAGLLAAFTLAVTPVVVVMNRYNNPDALLLFLLVLAAWAAVRAIETGRTRWLLLAMVFVGLGFNTKMLQAWMVVPSLVGAYLLAGHPRLRTRLVQLFVAGLVALAVSATWMLVVDLTPSESRPYVGGSTDNTVWDLVVGYNGLGRIFGGGGPGRGVQGPQAGQGPSAVQGPQAGQGPSAVQGPTSGTASPGGNAGAYSPPPPPSPAGAAASQTPGPSGRTGPGGFGGQSGWLRLFNEQIGDQISWLVPLATLGLVGGLVVTRRRPRTDLARASLVLWGIWLVVHWAVFSLAEGGFHPYYTNAIAPAIAALVGGGTVLLWRKSAESAWPVWVLAAGIAATAAWSVALLCRVPGWNEWLSPLVLLLGVGGAVALVAWRFGPRHARQAGAVILTVALAGALTGTAAYATTPLSTPLQGGDPVAGPTDRALSVTARPGGQGGPGGQAPAPPPPAGSAGPVAGGVPGANAVPPAQPPETGPPPPPAGGEGAGEYAAADEELIDYLTSHWDGEDWIVATSGSHAAAPIILATDGLAVMAMGGFSGGDPAPSAEDLARLVDSGRLRFVLLDSGPTGDLGGPASRRPADGGSTPGMARAGGQSAERIAWVQTHCETVDISGDGENTGAARLFDCRR